MTLLHRILLFILVSWSATSVSLFLFVIIMFKHLDDSYGKVLNYLILHTCSKALPICHFSTNVFNGSKYCPNLLENVGLHVPNRNFTDLVCLMLNLKIETVLPIDALRRLCHGQ